MARAKRHYLPGQIWHITHRCHKREFLLKFARDRRRWIALLLEAKKRYGLVVLNYAIFPLTAACAALDTGFDSTFFQPSPGEEHTDATQPTCAASGRTNI